MQHATTLLHTTNAPRGLLVSPLPSSPPLIRFDHPGRPPLCFCAPRRVLAAHTTADVAALLDEVDAETRAGAWAAGYVAYEAAPAFDTAMQVRPGTRIPLAWFGFFDAPTTVAGWALEDAPARYEPGRVGGAAQPQGARPSSIAPVQWRSRTDATAHADAVAQIRAGICAGDVYQVNHTIRFSAHSALDDRTLYDVLRSAQHGALGAYLDIGHWRIISASPELFFRRHGSAIETRPMKGTRRRGRWQEEDEALARELATSEKDRAENLMIVDLLRNDLGRIAQTGSVRVPELFTIERYPTVWQMTSRITAELPDGCSLARIFAALFPCGSVTGAPKIAAMKFITRLEDMPREVYCGAIGFVEPGGDCTFSVAIRTAWRDVNAGTLHYGAGGGITWDSDPAAEWDEVRAKTALLHRRPARFRLLETMRAESGSVARLDYHLERLFASARFLDCEVDQTAVRAAMCAAAANVTAPVRLRLLVGGPRNIEVQTRALAPLTGPVPVALSRQPVDSQDPFLYHKTTQRAQYEARAAQHPHGFDVLLVNERGELTEFTRGNLVIELAGERLTPARSCGLLAGVFRRALLEAGELREAVLGARDLESATRIWLINSVREWVPVALSAP